MSSPSNAVRVLVAVSFLSALSVGCSDSKPKAGETITVPKLELSTQADVKVPIHGGLLTWQSTPEAAEAKLKSAGFDVSNSQSTTFIFGGLTDGVENSVLADKYRTRLTARQVSRNAYAEEVNEVILEFYGGILHQVTEKVLINMLDADLTDTSLDPFGNSQSVLKVAKQKAGAELDRGRVNSQLAPYGFVLPNGSPSGQGEKCLSYSNEELADKDCANGILVSYTAYSERSSGPVRQCKEGPCAVSIFLGAKALAREAAGQAQEVGRKAFVEKFGEPEAPPKP